MSLTKHPEEAAVRVPLEHYMQGHATDDAAPRATASGYIEASSMSW